MPARHERCGVATGKPAKPQPQAKGQRRELRCNTRRFDVCVGSGGGMDQNAKINASRDAVEKCNSLLQHNDRGCDTRGTPRRAGLCAHTRPYVHRARHVHIDHAAGTSGCDPPDASRRTRGHPSCRLTPIRSLHIRPRATPTRMMRRAHKMRARPRSDIRETTPAPPVGRQDLRPGQLCSAHRRHHASRPLSHTHTHTRLPHCSVASHTRNGTHTLPTASSHVSTHRSPPNGDPHMHAVERPPQALSPALTCCPCTPSTSAAVSTRPARETRAPASPSAGWSPTRRHLAPGGRVRR